MRTLYRLYTERRSNLAELTSRHFNGFTLIDAVGYWQGASEPSTLIEIIGATTDFHARVLELARVIRETNGQQSVYLVRAECELIEVTADSAQEVA